MTRTDTTDEAGEEPESDETVVVGVTNQKGGVGKSTTAINIAGALNQLGANVLLVDMDPQGNATEGVGLLDAFSDDGTTLSDILVESADPVPAILPQPAGEMDVLPSHEEMKNVEQALNERRRSALRLLDAVDRIRESDDPQTDYDYIIVDAPPSLGVLTDSIHLASDYIIVPALTERTSRRAVDLLLDRHNAVAEQYRNWSVGDIHAVVANRIEQTGMGEEMTEWFYQVFQENGIPVYEVRKRVALQRAFASGTSIFEHSETSDMEDVYLNIARDIPGETA